MRNVTTTHYTLPSLSPPLQGIARHGIGKRISLTGGQERRQVQVFKGKVYHRVHLQLAKSGGSPNPVECVWYYLIALHAGTAWGEYVEALQVDEQAVGWYLHCEPLAGAG